MERKRVFTMVSVICDCGTSVDLNEVKAVCDIESDNALMRAYSVRCSGCGLLHIHCTVDLEVYERTGRPRLGVLDEFILSLTID